MAVIRQTVPNISTLRIAGLILIAFSAIVGPLILFATPIGCTIVGSIQLLIFGFLFIIGIAILVAPFFQKKQG